MSRIGRNPIHVPNGVTVTVNGNVVTVKGKLGELSQEIDKKIGVEVADGIVKVININDVEDNRNLHGLYRQLIHNMVEGVDKGYEKRLNVNGVGFKITKNGNDLVLNLGFSHPVNVKAIDGITLDFDKNVIIIKGINKELVGQFAAKVRSIKPVEPYHAYGISYVDEVIVRKESKSAKK